MSRIKRTGHYTSRNELDRNTTGIAVPVFGEDGDVAGSLVLAFASSDPPLIGETRLVEIAELNARAISRRCLASDASQEGDLKEPKETQDEHLRQLAQL
jgi:DNA-binding IclR family transcriptional regulator